MWPRAVVLQTFREANRKGRTHGLRHMRGDGTGLWWNVQIKTTEHLVATARNRVVTGCSKAQQHVIQGCRTGLLLGSLQEKGATAIMQKGRIRHAHRLGYRGIGFMAGTPDRVKALPRRLHQTRLQVE